MISDGRDDGGGADDGAFSPPDVAPDSATTDFDPEAVPALETALPVDRFAVEPTEAGTGDTPEGGEPPVKVPFNGEVAIEATGVVADPG